MAYMSQDNKKSKAPIIKSICKKYGITASLSVKHHSTLVLTIKSGKIDFIKNYAKLNGDDYIQVNTYWIDSYFSGLARNFLLEVKDAMMSGNHDNSDAMSDYYDVGWFIDINIGDYNKPYIFIC